MEVYQNVAVIAAVVIALIVFVNIVVQVTKKIIPSKSFPIQIWVLIVSIISTVLTGAIAFSILEIAIHWYDVVIALALSIIVCYGAMFGYDNLYKQVAKAIEDFKSLKGSGDNKE